MTTGGDAGQRLGRLNIEAKDVRMGVGRAQDRRVQRAGPHAEVVDVAPEPGEQGCVLDALHGPSDIAR